MNFSIKRYGLISTARYNQMSLYVKTRLLEVLDYISEKQVLVNTWSLLTPGCELDLLSGSSIWFQEWIKVDPGSGAFGNGCHFIMCPIKPEAELIRVALHWKQVCKTLMQCSRSRLLLLLVFKDLFVTFISESVVQSYICIIACSSSQIRENSELISNIYLLSRIFYAC